MVILTWGMLFAAGVLAQSDLDIKQCSSETMPNDERISACTRLIESGKFSSQMMAASYDNRGVAWHRKGDLDRAIADYNEALRLNPQFANAFNNRANDWNNKGDLDHAIADYNEAIRLNPHYTDAFFGRSLVWVNNGNLDRAIDDLSEVIRLDPQFAIAFNNRGRAWNNKGDYDRAIADYNEAIRLNPQVALTFNNRGNAWMYKDNYDRAIADYNEAIRLNPQFLRAFINRGFSQFYKAQFAMAADDFAAANQLVPNNTDTVVLLYLTRTRSGQNAQDDLAQKAKALPVDKWPAQVINLYLGNLNPEALASAAASPDPKTQAKQQCEASFYLGEWFLINHDTDRAKIQLRNAQADCPKDLDFLEYKAADNELKRLQ